jgi:sialate O-acetylesterase
VQTQTVADARGEWRVKVKTPPARPLHQGIRAEAITFTVPDENMVQIKDVLIGEVWLCSGQSNMTMMLGPDYPPGHNDWFGDKYWAEESSRTDRPAIRVFNVEKTARAAPQDDCKAVLPDHITLPKDAQGLTPDLRTGWQVCTPETAPYVSAVTYYFAVRLQEKLDVPVGVVVSSVGGSAIEAWTSLDALRQIPAYATITNRVHRMGAAALFNGMIAPLTPLTVRGVLWYQGESNVGASAVHYEALLKTLIADWRGRFGQTLPFGIVQLANYGNSPTDTRAAVVRAAQAAVAAEVPHTGLTVAIDLGEERIHPPNKRDVANRLALWARATVYGETDLVHQSPRYQSHSVQGGKIRIRFATGGSPLMVGQLDDSGNVNPAPGTKLQWFEIAGADGKFVPAEAVIDGDSVVVSSPAVSAPTAVRYAWATNPSGCNLYNEAGLPACPFSTGAATSRGL